MNAQRAAPVSTKATIMLAIAFMGSGSASVIREFTGSTGLYLGVSLASLLCFAGVKLVRPVQPWKFARDSRIITFLALASVIAFLSGAVAMTQDRVGSEVMITSLSKAGGLILSILLITRYAPSYREKEIRYALLIYASIEMFTIYGGFRFLHLDFNINGVALREVTCGIVLFCLIQSKWLRVIPLVAGLGVAFSLQSRTSAVATVGALVLSRVERSSRRERNSVPVVALLLLTVLVTYQSTIKDVLQDIAISNLGSQNPIAAFFLSDKDVNKVSDDYLDRSDVWMASWRYIKQSPLIGHGIGLENTLFGARSHNAYLSLLVEGGVLYLLAWTGVYGILFMKLYDSQWALIAARTPLFMLMVTLFAYMLLAAMVETSGIGSVATPNNTICLFLALWFSYHVPVQAVQATSQVGPARPSEAR